MPHILDTNGSNGAKTIPHAQTAALVRKLGGPVEFDDNYPVPKAGHNEVLAKVLYTGVCQSGKSPSSPLRDPSLPPQPLTGRADWPQTFTR